MPPGALLRGHEFHHSSLVNLDPSLRFAYRVQRGHGIDGQCDGLCMHNLLASYTTCARRGQALGCRVSSNSCGAAALQGPRRTAPSRAGPVPA
jgi:cobyrinic acid a,c-diamide synthase